MENIKPVNLKISGRDTEVTPNNLGIAMFRKTPDLDYLDYHEPVEGEDTESHTLIFRHREFLLWLGGVGLTEADRKIIRLSARQLGSFLLRSEGWRPPVFIEDSASEWETEMFIQSELPNGDDAWHKELEDSLREDLE